jgi:opacity protein-like surface antigen
MGRIAIPLLLLMANMARASELPAPATWNGFYVGGNLGYGKARASADFDIIGVPAIAASEDLSGAVYGGQHGYNAQWGPLVLGLETDLMATSQKATSSRQCLALTCGIAVTQTSDDSIPWLGTTRCALAARSATFWSMAPAASAMAPSKARRP